MNNSFLEIPFFEPLADTFELLLSNQVVLAPILLLTVEEAGIPLPVPGDVVIAYSGYNISRGLVSYPVALVMLMVSILVGATILFFLSRKWGNLLILKFGKYLHLQPERLITVEQKFKKYGPLVIIFGRHIPGFRIPITVFAGISGISYRSFILSTFVSTLFWVIFYLDLGIKLGKKVSAFLRVSSTYWLFILAAILIMFAAYLYLRYSHKEIA